MEYSIADAADADASDDQENSIITEDIEEIKVEIEPLELDNEPEPDLASATADVEGIRDRHEFRKRNNKENISRSKKCIVCGMRSILQSQPDVFEIWNFSCAQSLSKSFGIDVSKLQNASYCQECFQITRDIDFFIRSISSFEIELRKAETLLQERINMNPRTPFAQLSSPNSNAKTTNAPITKYIVRKRRKLLELRKRGGGFIDTGSNTETNETSKLKTRLRPLNSKSAQLIVPDKLEDEIENENNNDGFDDDEYTQPNSVEVGPSSDDEEYSPKKKKIGVAVDDQKKNNKSNKTATAIPPKKKRNRASKSTGHWKFHCLEVDCTFRCAKEISFKVHMRSVHIGDPTPYHCENQGCDAKYKLEESLGKHMRKCAAPLSTALPSGLYIRCPSGRCCKTFASEAILQEHFKKVHPEYIRKRCEFCYLSFATEDTEGLKEHEDKHRAAEVPFSCIINGCDCIFTNFLDLKQHVAKTHEEIAIKCDKCPEVLPNVDAFKRHQKKVHSEIPKEEFVCPDCGYITTVKSLIKAHVKIHSDERPFMCEECGAAFKRPSALRRHKLVHTDEKRFECKVCGKKFRLGQELKNHEETHVPTKTYLCSGCGKAFRGCNNLRQHQSFHCPQLPTILSAAARKRLVKQGKDVPPVERKKRTYPPRPRKPKVNIRAKILVEDTNNKEAVHDQQNCQEEEELMDVDPWCPTGSINQTFSN